MHHFAISMYDILILAVLCLTFMLPSMDVGELPPVPRFSVQSEIVHGRKKKCLLLASKGGVKKVSQC